MVFENLFTQVKAAEELGFDTIWVAESHFSSEVQKSHRHPVIPRYQGEVGLNADSMQLAQCIFARTKKIHFGTAIHNIVGGNGGPIASADRVRTLAFLNQFLERPRVLNIGVAQGRFPYINSPFGIVPRDEVESALWEPYKRLIFLEALEIFLRLSLGEQISSAETREWKITQDLLSNQESWNKAKEKLGKSSNFVYRKRWQFEVLKLVPELSGEGKERVNFVLGSHDPMGRDLGFSLCDMDVFNLSFTPVDQINLIHQEMELKCRALNRRPWQRRRLPRTVLVFIDNNADEAKRRASLCFDTYIEAMRGTVGFPGKDVLMSKALIGSPKMIIDQLSPGHERGFEKDDRLMLWFEFNQSDNHQIINQMRLFSERIMPVYV